MPQHNCIGDKVIMRRCSFVDSAKVGYTGDIDMKFCFVSTHFSSLHIFFISSNTFPLNSKHAKKLKKKALPILILQKKK